MRQERRPGALPHGAELDTAAISRHRGRSLSSCRFCPGAASRIRRAPRFKADRPGELSRTSKRQGTLAGGRRRDEGEPDLTPTRRKQLIREWGAELGFARVAIAVAEEPSGSRRLLDWLRRELHGEMAYMARDPARRLDPQAILPGMRSCITVALPYYHSDSVPLSPKAGRVSRYAWGADYHEVMREKLEALEARIREACPGVTGRRACDTSPVMDKAWAAAAGLGWLGKNTCLIDRRLGSWFFIGEIFLDLELPPDPVVADSCGTCRRCLDVCPTGALVEPYVLDARLCISYLNLEYRGSFSPEQAGAVGDWLAGCDLCQDVCPWNSKATVSPEARFAPRLDGPAALTPEQWSEVSDETWRDLVRGSALSRIKPGQARRNGQAARAYRDR